MTAPTLSPTRPPLEPQEQEALSQAIAVFRAAAPNAAGVVLATPEGTPLASDLPAGADAATAAVAALAERVRRAQAGARAGAGLLVDASCGAVLVVFLGEPAGAPAERAPPLAAAA